MKTLGFTVAFFICCGTSRGQVPAELPLSERAGSSQKVNLESRQERFVHLTDTLSPSLGRIDSIRNGFSFEVYRMQEACRHRIEEIEAQERKIYHPRDSVQKLGLPAVKYSRALDSLEELKNGFESKYRSMFDSLRAKALKSLQSIDLPPEYKQPVQELTTNIADMDLDTDISNIQSLSIPRFSHARLNGSPNLPLARGDISSISNVANVPDVQAPVDSFNDLSGQVVSYEGDFKSITEGNMQNIEKLPETIEDQASKIDGMEEIQQQTRLIEEHNTEIDKLADPKNAKENVISLAKEKAVDHFAGKQEQVEAAMNKISKYKQKYSSVSSIKNLPKRRPNPMKGRPFFERLKPGLYFQYQQKTYYLMDLNPYISYKVSGRFATGLGWNERIGWDSRYERRHKPSRIFGPRGFVDFQLAKRFIAHIEGESMNSFVPSALHGNPDAGRREWVWSCMMGIKKEYRIYKNLKGTALIQYNIFNRYYKAPYVDRLNSRIGFEYTLKKKTRER